MAYNVTDRQQQRAAARDTAIKLKQENKMSRRLMSLYFLPVARDFVKAYSKTGATPNLTEHNQNLNKVLNKNYENTSGRFISQVRDQLGQPENAEEMNNNINFSQNLTQTKDVHFSSQSISKTTGNNLRDNVTKVLLGAAIAGVALTHKQVAKKSGKQFVKDSRGRLNTISLTQTQQAAEGAKYNEVNVLNKNNAFFPRVNLKMNEAKVSKAWIPILDSRTRHAHAAADNQTVPFNEAYTVGGQRLKYPGDTSLGATLDNTINCRCSSVKTIKRQR